MIPDFVLSPNPELLLTDNYLVLDFETTNLEKGSALNPDNRLVISSWWYDGLLKSIAGSEFVVNELLCDIEKADLIVAHNAKFELQWLARIGVKLNKILIYDTMLGEYVLLSNTAGKKGNSISLEATSERYGYGTKDAYVQKCMESGVCPSEMPTSLIQLRCNKDVEQTRMIFLDQREILRKHNLLATQYTRCLFVPVLAHIEAQGLALDKERVEEEYNKAQLKAQDLEKQLVELTGGINPNSPPQVAKYLYETLKFDELKDRKGNAIRGSKTKQFPEGQPKTDAKTIAKLKSKTPEQRKFLQLKKEYAKVTAALSKSLEFFLGVVREKDGIFFGQFNQALTATQRLSSSGRKLKFNLFKKEKSAQLQNLPRVFKRLFRTKSSDYVYCEPDGAQLEFRVAAHLGRDRQAIQDIVDNVDVHTFTANTISAAGQATDRQGAKSHTFKPLYGGQSGTPAEQAYYKAFREKYKGIADTQKNWILTVLANKKLITETGLVFFWPDTYQDARSGYVNNREAICNYPVQSLATADIIPIAMIKLWHELLDKNLKSVIINTVHDSSPMEVHRDEIEIVKPLIIEAYTDYVYFYLEQVYGIKFVAPLGVGMKFGEHWGEGEEIKMQVSPPTKLEGVLYDVDV